MPAILPLHKITNSFKIVKRKRVRAKATMSDSQGRRQRLSSQVYPRMESATGLLY